MPWPAPGPLLPRLAPRGPLLPRVSPRGPRCRASPLAGLATVPGLFPRPLRLAPLLLPRALGPPPVRAHAYAVPRTASSRARCIVLIHLDHCLRSRCSHQYYLFNRRGLSGFGLVLFHPNIIILSRGIRIIGMGMGTCDLLLHMQIAMLDTCL